MASDELWQDLEDIIGTDHHRANPPIIQNDDVTDQLDICCLVCGGPSEGHLYYGALVCHRCRVFFRRTAQKERKYKCKNGTGKCRYNN